MKFFVFFFLFLYSVLSFAERGAHYPTWRDVDIRSLDNAKSEKKLLQFLQQSGVAVKGHSATTSRASIEFILPVRLLDSMESIIPQLGSVTDKTYAYYDAETKIQEIELQIRDLQTSSDSDYIRRKTIEKESAIKEIRENAGYAYFRITMVESSNYDNSYDDGYSLGRVRFVNMPGFEYGFMVTENPEAGYSAKYYHSYMLKYLFTRGKSYFSLGVMKAADANTLDTAMYKDYFVFNFGQDFYTRHLGRGTRRFLNPYTGYKIGFFIANNDMNTNKFIFNMNVAIGLELIKTRYFLLDSKVEYFLPVHKYNKTMRGFIANVSASYIF